MPEEPTTLAAHWERMLLHLLDDPSNVADPTRMSMLRWQFYIGAAMALKCLQNGGSLRRQKLQDEIDAAFAPDFNLAPSAPTPGEWRGNEQRAAILEWWDDACARRGVAPDLRLGFFEEVEAFVSDNVERVARAAIAHANETVAPKAKVLANVLQMAADLFAKTQPDLAKLFRQVAERTRTIRVAIEGDDP